MSWVRFLIDAVIRIFYLPRVVPWFPLLGLKTSGTSWVSLSTLIYTSELILCSTIYIRLCTTTYGHPRLCRAMYGHARLCTLCKAMHEYTRLWTSMHGRASLCKATCGHARVCTSMHNYVRPCTYMHGYVRLYMAMYSYVQLWLCTAMQSYIRLCTAIHGYARLCKAIEGYVQLWKFVLSTELINVNWPLYRDWKADVSSVSLRQSESRNCGLCKVYIQKMELRYWWEPGDGKNRNK